MPSSGEMIIGVQNADIVITVKVAPDIIENARAATTMNQPLQGHCFIGLSLAL